MSVFVQEVCSADLALAAAAGVPETTIGEAQWDGTVTEVSFTSESNLTGATATARTMTVYNRGNAGAGTTVVATAVFNTGTNLVANDEFAFTLTATVADRNFSKDDVFECVETVASTGTARGEGRLVIKGTRR